MGVLEGNTSFSIVRADPNSSRGWRSRYYGDKEPAISVLLETIHDSACFWSYFCSKTDKVTIAAGILDIAASGWNTKIDLNDLNK